MFKRIINNNEYVRLCLCFFALVILLVAVKNVNAQSENQLALHYSHSITMEEGIASNNVNAFCKDKTGAIWIATDNGITRADGHNYKNYTTADGLPDLDIVFIVPEKDGTIWVSTISNELVYYSQQLDRFVKPDWANAALIAAKQRGDLLRIHALPSGGISIRFSLKNLLIKNKQIVKEVVTYSPKYKMVLDYKTKDRWTSLYTKEIYMDSLLLKRQFGKKMDSVILKIPGFFLNCIADEKHTIIYSDNFIYMLESGDALDKITELKLDFKPMNLSLGKNYISIVGTDKKVRLFNRHSKNLLYTTSVINIAKSSFADKDGVLYVGTVNNGIEVYKSNDILKSPLPLGIKSQQITSIQKIDNVLFLGNNANQIIVPSKKKIFSPSVSGNGNETIKAIFNTPKGLFVCSDGTTNINGNLFTYKENKKYCPNAKAILQWDDSSFIIGTHYELFKTNIFTRQVEMCTTSGRVSSLLRLNKNLLLLGTAQGLKIYNFTTHQISDISYNKLELEKGISALAGSNADSLIWIGTKYNGIFLLYRDSIIANIKTNDGLLSNEVLCLQMGQLPELLVGTKSGLSKIKYEFSNHNLKYSIENILFNSQNQNLAVYSLLQTTDSLHIGTNGGLFTFPINYKQPKVELEPILLHLKINGKDVPIKNEYSLSSKETNMELLFSCTDFEHQFKNYLYQIDNEDWVQLNQPLLNIRLREGSHIFTIKAIDINGVESKKQLKIKFEIAFPFYKSILFWIAITLIITSIIFYFWNKIKQRQLQANLMQQKLLHAQREKITADLHDDMGSALSALQLNTAIANMQMDKDPAKAKRILIQVEEQSKQVAEKLSDLIWSMKPGENEFLNFSTRIKNFANELLGASEINYSVNIAPTLDASLTEVTTRKNLLFFLKEAINNAAKYSKANNINIEVIQLENRVIATIADDGMGFEPNSKGNGLRTMEQRINELGGDLKIESIINKGTSITASVPLLNIKEKI